MSVFRPDTDGFYQPMLVGPLRQFLAPVELRNGEQMTVGAMRTLDGIFVAVVGRGAALWHYGAPVAVHSVCEMYNLGAGTGHAEALTDLINDQVCPGTPRKAGSNP